MVFIDKANIMYDKLVTNPTKHSHSELLNTCSKSFSCSICQTYPWCQGLTAVRGIRSNLRISHHNIDHRCPKFETWTLQNFDIKTNFPSVVVCFVLPFSSRFLDVTFKQSLNNIFTGSNYNPLVWNLELTFKCIALS